MNCRDAFVIMIKEENFYGDISQSLRQHWSGKKGGFADQTIQKRWSDFQRGWNSALTKTEV